MMEFRGYYEWILNPLKHNNILILKLHDKAQEITDEERYIIRGTRWKELVDNIDKEAIIKYTT